MSGMKLSRQGQKARDFVFRQKKKEKNKKGRGLEKREGNAKEL